MAAAALLLALSPAVAEARTAEEDAEARMVAAINDVRKNHGIDGLRRSDSLMGSAGRFSRWLMENDTFGHAGSIQASSDFVLLGEALAMHTGRRFRVHRTLRAWMRSASHRAIVLSRTMPWVGAGVTRGRYGASRATIWVIQTGRLAAPEPKLPSLPLP